jgi:hypothetical protein
MGDRVNVGSLATLVLEISYFVHSNNFQFCCYVFRIDRQHYYHTTLPAIGSDVRVMALTIEHRCLLDHVLKHLVENLYEREIHCTK